jgi:hypothetical protein
VVRVPGNHGLKKVEPVAEAVRAWLPGVVAMATA